MLSTSTAGTGAALPLARPVVERSSTGHRTRTTQGSTHVLVYRGMSLAAIAHVHQCHGPVDGVERAYWIQCRRRSRAHNVGIGNARDANRCLKPVEHRFEHRLGDANTHRTHTTSPINARFGSKTETITGMFRRLESIFSQRHRALPVEYLDAVVEMAARTADTVPTSPYNAAICPGSIPPGELNMRNV